MGGRRTPHAGHSLGPGVLFCGGDRASHSSGQSLHHSAPVPSAVNRPDEFPLQGATAMKRDKYLKVSGTLDITLYLRAPKGEARGPGSPRSAAGDRWRGSGSAKPGVQAAAGAEGARFEGRLRARRGLGAAEGNAAEAPQSPLPDPGVSRPQLKALWAPHLRLPPLASECFPALRRRRLPFPAAVAVAIGWRATSPGRRGILHAAPVSSSALLLCALCPGRPRRRRALGARSRPLHNDWLRQSSSAPPHSAIGCYTSPSGTWRWWGAHSRDFSPPHLFSSVLRRYC